MIPHSVQHIALLACVGLLLWAAASDFLQFRIPNRLSLAIAALWPAYAASVALGGGTAGWSGALIAAAAVFVGGFVLFNRGLVGGGDVKLLTAVALWSGLDGLLPLLLVIGTAGGLLSLGLIAARAATLMAQPASRVPGLPVWRAALRQPAPYGVAIAAGGLFMLGRLAGFRIIF